MFYAAHFLHLCSEMVGLSLSLKPGGISFNTQNPIPYKSQKTKRSLKQARKKRSKGELPKQRNGPKRTEKRRLKAPPHIWEQEARGASPHILTKVDKTCA